MTEPPTVVSTSWHDLETGLTLEIVRHDSGAGPVYRLKDLHGIFWAWGSEDRVKEIAKKLLGEIGHHQCSEKCRDWEAVSN